MITRTVYYTVIKDYLEDLVSKTPYIKEFIGVSPEELQSKLAKTGTQAVTFPILLLISYEGKLNGNNQRTLGTRVLTFSVLFHCRADDYPKQDEAYSLGEIYGLNIISRIKIDAERRKYPWFEKFEKSSVNFSTANYENAPTLFGCEFSLDIEHKDPLDPNPEFWSDVEDFCNYP